MLIAGIRAARSQSSRSRTMAAKCRDVSSSSHHSSLSGCRAHSSSSRPLSDGSLHWAVMPAAGHQPPRSCFARPDGRPLLLLITMAAVPCGEGVRGARCRFCLSRSGRSAWSRPAGNPPRTSSGRCCSCGSTPATVAGPPARGQQQQLQVESENHKPKPPEQSYMQSPTKPLALMSWNGTDEMGAVDIEPGSARAQCVTEVKF